MKYLSLKRCLDDRVRLVAYGTAALWAAVSLGVVVSTGSFAYAVDPGLSPPERRNIFPIQSIDTMKYSRDKAREMLYGLAYYRTVIDEQTASVASSGATHIAISTPYDEEFHLVLAMWVASARAHGLSVWFRGNFSGWEGWFGYPRIGRQQHAQMVDEFIRLHPDLFQDGDIFTSCPECENGGPGDPRSTGDLSGHRAFLIAEYDLMQKAFHDIGKQVDAGKFSMNADVARLVMDKATTAALGGTVTLDHYVPSPEKFESDIRDIAASSGGKIVLGEFGAPIPEINGYMTESAQADFVGRLLEIMQRNSDIVIGVNYWTLSGGSAELVTAGRTRPAFETVKDIYKAAYVAGRVFDEADGVLKGICLSAVGGGASSCTNARGEYQLFAPATITVDVFDPKERYASSSFLFSPAQGDSIQNVILRRLR